MNNINFSRARNGTRIALNKNHLILLVALAVLSLVIVSLCVFNNLNALATNNIAFAEDVDSGFIPYSSDTRTNIAGAGFSRDNLLGNNCIFTNIDSFSFSSNYSVNSWYSPNPSLILSYSLASDGLHISLGSNAVLIYVTDFTSATLEPIGCMSVGYKAVTNSNYCQLATYNVVVTGLRNSATFGSTSGITWNNISVGYGGSDLAGFGIYTTGSCELVLSYIKYEDGSSFTGQPSNSYSPNGFDAGVNSVEVEHSVFTNDTGLVGSNILKYNYWLDAEFDYVSAGTTTIWEQDDQSIQLVNGTLRDNVLTATTAERQQHERSGVRSSTMLKYIVPYRNGGAEVFAVYVSALTGSWELGLMNSGRSVILSVGLNVLYIPATEPERVPSETYNIFTLNDNDSITISWCKLESGTAFTGYVAPDNANSYESGYEQGLIDGYYNGITDLNSIKTVLDHVNLDTKGPYYVVGTTYESYGVNHDYMDVTYSISSSISGVTYGNYIPVIFNLGYNVPVGLDLIWKFKGQILNPHSSEVDPDGASNIYYGFYNSISFVTYGPEYAPYQDIITWPSSSTEDYQVMFHARFSGSYLVLWFYTDNDNPYYEFGIRTPVVDGNFDSNPFYFEFNPYTITDSSVNLDNARQQGYQEGFNSGYNQGKFENSVSGQYTFKNLIGSVFDAPISALLGTYDERQGARVGGLLNFEVLGVNLGGFVIGLLSLAIILFVLRVFMRGL